MFEYRSLFPKHKQNKVPLTILLSSASKLLTFDGIRAAAKNPEHHQSYFNANLGVQA